jgi:hypothetical protein
MTSIFAEAWSDSKKDMRRGARRWLRHHPATNLLAWGVTAVTFTLPKRALTNAHRKAYKQRVTFSGRPAVTTTTATATTTTVTSSTTKSGAIGKQQTTTTTSTSTTATTTSSEVIHMSTTSRLLGSGDLARSYATVIDQVSEWKPIQGFAANSIVDACADLKIAAGQIGSGLENLNTTLLIGNVDKRVRERIAAAITMLGNATDALQNAADKMNAFHIDQINQEASGVAMVTFDAVRGVQAAPLQTRTAASRAALLISGWFPEAGDVTNGVWSHLATNKIALTLWGKSLDEMSGRLKKHGVHYQVGDHLDTAAWHLRFAGQALHGAQQAFMTLYASQNAAENNGATIIPIDR